MPGAGTDKTKRWIETPAPIVVLVEPQLGENIGAAARAMANFGLSRLRLVKPLQGWPNEKARVMAAGADRVLEGATLHDSLDDAIGDCSFVLATTARNHDQAKPVVICAGGGSGNGAAGCRRRKRCHRFGRERIGLENHEVALADRIVTLPVNPAFASLNLAQAVVIVAYEWFKCAGGGELPFAMPEKSPPAPKQQLDAFFSRSRARARTGRIFSPGGEARHHERQPAQYFSAHGADAAGHPHAARRGQRHRRRDAKGPARGGVLDRRKASSCAICSRSKAVAACRASARRCAAWRGFCGAIRRRPSACCGRRW